MATGANGSFTLLPQEAGRGEWLRFMRIIENLLQHSTLPTDIHEGPLGPVMPDLR